MSSRSIRALSISFFLLIVVGITIAGLVVRAKHLDEANKTFQSCILDAEQFILTYQTMDPGLRRKISESIFATIKHDNLVQSLYILDQKQTPLLVWLPHSSQITNVPKVILDQSNLQIAVLQTSLPGSGHLIVSHLVLPYEELAILVIVAISALILLAIFLIFQLLVSQSTTVTEDQLEPDGQEATGKTLDKPEYVVDNLDSKPNDDNTKQPETTVESPLSKDPADSKFLILDKTSGVSQERFLKFRLDKELERSAENAIDMSIALFKFHNLGSDTHSVAAQLLLSEFGHEDLIFESGDDVFCVIMPQHDLDQAIARADLLIRKSESSFASETKPIVVFAGLSSRNGRLLDSTRFIKEAQVALRKSNIREGRIVGFRPDPVRFRNFLRHHRV